MAKIDQNGKGLAFTFCSILAIFLTFQNGAKCLKNEKKLRLALIILLHFKRFLKNYFKNFKPLGLPISTAQVAQDATQVAQDACKNV